MESIPEDNRFLDRGSAARPGSRVPQYGTRADIGRCQPSGDAINIRERGSISPVRSKGVPFAMNARHRDPKPPNGHASRRLTVRPDHPIPPRPGRVTPNLPRHHQLVPPDPKPSNILRVPAIATTLPAAPDRTTQTQRCIDAMTSPPTNSNTHPIGNSQTTSCGVSGETDSECRTWNS